MARKVTVDLGDGVERQIRYTVGQTERLREKYGEDKALLEMPFPKFLEQIVYEGLVAPDFPVDQMKELVEMSQRDEILDRFFRAFYGKSLEELQKIGEQAAKNEQSSQTVQ